MQPFCEVTNPSSKIRTIYHPPVILPFEAAAVALISVSHPTTLHLKCVSDCWMTCKSISTGKGNYPTAEWTAQVSARARGTIRLLNELPKYQHGQGELCDCWMMSTNISIGAFMWEAKVECEITVLLQLVTSVQNTDQCYIIPPNQNTMNIKIKSLHLFCFRKNITRWFWIATACIGNISRSNHDRKRRV
jgi:hypothetical protein